MENTNETLKSIFFANDITDLFGKQYETMYNK